jgi:hypothetical protein
MLAAIPRSCVTLSGSEGAGLSQAKLDSVAFKSAARGGYHGMGDPAFGATGAVRRLPVIDRVCELVVKGMDFSEKACFAPVAGCTTKGP